MVKYYSKSMSTAFSISRVDKRKNPNKNDNNLNYFIDIFGDKVVVIS
ncbi:MAG: hypothetical protein IJX26_02255 [Clostridia bacterium]|nr:hypothetical protein [Clostridia bacterium]